MRHLLGVGLILTLITAGTSAATPTAWRETDWEHPQAIIIAPGTLGIPYVEQAELGPTAFGLKDNRFGSVTATWSDTDTSWLAVTAPNELNAAAAGAVYVFSRAHDSADWHQEARLTANDGKEGDGFGNSVAIGSDIVVVGAPSHKIGSISGAVYTFIRDKTTSVWSQRGAALGASTAGNFGASVALEGDTLAVGAPSTATSGHVYVYQNFGGSWSTVGNLSPSDSPPDAYFGGSIAIDNGRLLIGARYDSTFAQYEGAAYVFAYESATNSWEQQQKLVPYPDGAAGDNFGQTVALAGSFAVVAATGRNLYQGAADLFSFDSGSVAWIKQGSLQGPAGPNGYFGNSLALSPTLLAVGSLGKTDANIVYLYTTALGTATFQSSIPAESQQISGDFGQSLSWSNGELLVSAPEATVDRTRGIVHQFSPTASSWTELQPVSALGDQGEEFGRVVAISDDVAVVRAPNQNDFYGDEGAADVYGRDANGNWVWKQELSDNFGGPVAIEGNTLVIGAPAQAFGDNHSQGAAYIYEKSGDNWIEQAELADLLEGTADDSLGTSVAISGDTVIVGAPGINGDIGGAFVYVRSGTTWTRQAKLTATGASVGDYVGVTVALRGNTALIGAPAYSGRTFPAVYVFQRSGSSWVEKKKLVNSDGVAGDEFGGSLALFGNAILIGSEQHRVGANFGQGRVYIYSGSAWDTESTIDSPAGIPSGHFGASIAVDGNRLVVGEAGQNSAHLFYSDHGIWSLQSSLIDVAGSYFGGAVAASNGIVLVGAEFEGNGSNHGGRAHIFQDDRIFADGFN
jgi:FG-GAP repeat